MASIERISTNTPWEPIFGYSRAVRFGEWIAVSGTTATDKSGQLVGINQMYVQAKQALANIASALQRAGASLNDVIRTRVFVTDISRFQDVARAHREVFGDAPPASTAVEVRRLAHPDMLVEIEADAVTRSAAKTDAARPPVKLHAVTLKKTAKPRLVKKTANSRKKTRR